MKLTPSQLFKSSQNELSTVYLIYGDDYVLLSEISAFINKLVPNHEIIYVESDFNWQLFAINLNSIDFFENNDRTIIELRILTPKINTHGANLLIEYIKKKIPRNKLLIITFPKYSKELLSTDLVKIIDQYGIIISVYELTHFQLLPWIDYKFKQLKINVANPNCIDTILEYTNGNTINIKQEIEKLYFAYGNENILTQQHILNVIEPSSKSNIFKLIEQFYSKNKSAIITAFFNLIQQERNDLLMLWAITRELSLLIKLKLVLSNSKKLNEIINTSHYKFKKNITLTILNLLKNIQLKHLKKNLNHAFHLDFIIKGIDKYQNAEQKLLKLINNFYDTIHTAIQ